MHSICCPSCCPEFWSSLNLLGSLVRLPHSTVCLGAPPPWQYLWQVGALEQTWLPSVSLVRLPYSPVRLAQISRQVGLNGQVVIYTKHEGILNTVQERASQAMGREGQARACAVPSRPFHPSHRVILLPNLVQQLAGGAGQDEGRAACMAQLPSSLLLLLVLVLGRRWLGWRRLGRLGR